MLPLHERTVFFTDYDNKNIIFFFAKIGISRIRSHILEFEECAI